MPTVRRSVQIDSGSDEVIEYIADVTHHPAFIPSLNSVDDITGDPREPGTEWSWSYTMAGVQFQGRAAMVDYERGSLYSFRTFGGLDSTFVYTVEPTQSGTQLTGQVEYEVPQNVLARVADGGAIERLNEGVADQAIHNLKAIFEG
jgi:carbon monoxide dehydrogenase subunit G